MIKNDMIFFQKAAKRICGSLEIKTTLENCITFLKDYMPINGMVMNIYDAKNRLVKNIALASDLEENRIKNFGPVRLNQEAVDYIETLPPVPKPAQIINHPEKQVMTGLVWQAMGRPELSFLRIHPVADEVKLGAVFIFAQGFDRYEPEHARLFTLLHDLFVIALANTVRHQEVLELKEMLADDNLFLNNQLRQVVGDEIIGRNSGLRQVMKMVNQVAPLASHVLLLGETGVGKEVIADAIHYSSPRANGPFIKVNCGAIPESLIDSELFGHERGAFTGAVKRSRGRFERADKGTVFLDEIGELPPRAQVRLLRVLQNREIERVGGSDPISVDVRIIAATHRNIEEMVNNGGFRKDLYYRLHVFPINIPPLRSRLSDLPELVDYFLQRKSREMNLKRPPVPSPDFLQALGAYHWPGNVRELENIIERALIRNLFSPPQTPLTIDSLESPAMIQGTGGIHGQTRIYNLDHVTREHIKSVLSMTQGRIKGKYGAAGLLGVNPSTLRNRMIKLGIPFGARCRRSN